MTLKTNNIDCSIIIPAYNAESTIIRALDSLHLDEQWNSNIEIIIIDDGSIDSTSKLINDFCCKYNNVYIVDKYNRGVSNARNIGIEIAIGRYIYFVDADDEINRYELDKNILRIIDKNIDIAIFDYIIQDLSSGLTETISSFNSIDECRFNKKYYIKKILPSILEGNERGFASLCNKIYNKTLIDKCKIKINEKLKHSEDWDFNLKIFEEANNFIYIKNYIFYYNHKTTNEDLSKYKRDILYGIENGIKQKTRLIKKYGLFEIDSLEFAKIIAYYADEISRVVINNEISINKRKEFLHKPLIFYVTDYTANLSKERLEEIGYSRKEKFGFLLLSKKHIYLYRAYIYLIEKIL